MRKLLLSIYFTLNLAVFSFAQVCTNGTTTVGGISFNDFNENGIKDATETVQSNITVNVYDCNGALVQSNVTDANGDWSVTVPTIPSATVKYRVEFIIPSNLAALGLQPSANGTGNRTNVQFIGAATCSSNFGVNYSGDYCQSNPPIAIPCYEPGNLVYGASGNTNKGLISIPYNSSGPTVTGVTGIAGLNEIGSVWGMGFQTANKRLFASTFLKRHTGLGPRGMGGVYVVDFSGTGMPTLVNSFDLQGIAPANGGATIDVGDVIRTGSADYTLPNDNVTPSIDLDAFAKIGKVGFGGTEVGPDGNTLWLVNLNQKALISVDITNTTTYPGVVKQYPLSNFTGLPTCTSGTLRPWGLKMYRGRGYLGLVCDASTSQSASNLVAYVLSFDPSNPTAFTTEITFNLNYLREKATDFPTLNPVLNEPGTWNAWADTWAQTNITTSPGTEEAYPQPILSDMEFSENGSMILAFCDRFGHQAGYQQYIAVAGTTRRFSVDVAGDIIHVCNINGTWDLEGGTCAESDNSAAQSTLNNDGPSGTGEFYYGDNFDDTGRTPTFNHNETSMGALAVLKGTNEVMSINMDPVNGNSFAFDQGFVWFNTTTGARTDQFRLIASGPASNKGNGLGDIEMICAPAPLEIGNYVWIDTDRDGIQDPCEGPLSNVTVKLYKMGTAAAIATTTTNANGEYYFKDYYEFGTGYDTLALGATYYVVIGEGGQWSTANKSLSLTGTNYVLTAQNTTTGGGNEYNDNDAFLINDVTKTFNGYLVDTVTIPANGTGYVNHNLDFGLFICPAINTPSAAQSVCNGLFPSALSIKTTYNTTNGIKFVAFTADQIAGATPTDAELLTIYSGGTTLATVTPTGGVAPYTAAFTPTSGQFVNNGTTDLIYYVYAILNPDLGANCRPLQEIVITVKPTPSVNTVSNKVACSGATVSATNFASTPSGSTFSWTNNNTATGLAASGTGNIAAFTAANVATQQVSTLTITPTINGCVGTNNTFTITVNPNPTVSITPINQTICGGSTIIATNFTSTPLGATFSWTNNNTATGVSASGTGNIAAISAANVSAQQASTITVVPTLSSCSSAGTAFTVTVKPNPSVILPSNQSICSGATVSAMNFSSLPSGATFNWTNNNTTTGLAASGTGNIASFAASTVTTQQVSTISVTPTLNGCVGASQTFTLTVNPNPVVTITPMSQTVCSGANVVASTFTSTPSGATFSWTNNNTNTGLTASGTGNIAAFTASNVATQRVSTVTVTPSLNGCTTAGAPQTFTITVKPNPSVNTPVDQTICAGTTVLATNFVSTPTGSTFSWANNNTNTGLSASGTGNVAAFTAANVATQQVSTVTITPTLRGCVGTTNTFNITANPNPTLSITATTCAIDLLTYSISFTSNGVVSSTAGTVDNMTGTVSGIAAGTNVILTSTLNSCISTISVTSPACSCPMVNPPTNGGDPIICQSQTIPTMSVSVGTNETVDWYDAPDGGTLLVTGNVNYTPTVAGIYYAETRNTITNCLSDSRTAVQLSIKPTPSVSSVADVVFCANDLVPTMTFNGTMNATFMWTNSNANIGLSASGNGNILAFNAANVSSQEVATITVTPILNGCVGTNETFSITINPNPTLSVTSTTCSANLLTYSVLFTSNGTVTSDFGTVDNVAHTVTNISAGQNITLTAALTSCTASQLVTAPSCACPLVDAPLSAGNQIICQSQTISNLSVTVNGGETADWYNAATGGTLLATGTLNYLPTSAGTYYAQARNTTTDCISIRTALTLTIKPTPSVSDPLDQIVCSGITFGATTFVGTANATFDWTNDNTTIGLAASGTGGEIHAFISSENAAQQVASVVVTPNLNGCIGTSETFTLTVKPTPSVSATPTNQIVCGGTNVLATTFTGIAGTLFNWTNNNSNTGLSASNSGNIPAFVANSVTNQEISVIEVTPVLNGCMGTPVDFNLTVKPVPTVANPVDQIICGGSLSATTMFSGTLAGTTFEWLNNNVNTGLVVNGTNNIPVFATDNVATTQVSTVTVTPVLNGCMGSSETFTMTVNPYVTGGYVIIPAPICQSGSNIPILNLRDYLGNESDGGVWTDVSTTSVGSRFNPTTAELNTNSLISGTYVFRYYLTGLSPCANDARDVTISIEKCCPVDICLPVTIQKF